MDRPDTGQAIEVGPEFHWEGGWYFARVTELGDMLGAVRVRVVRDGITDEQFIPAAEWASIVAAVAVEGDSTTPYRVAAGLHGVPRVD